MWDDSFGWIIDCRVYVQTDAYQTTGCYNLLCSGFIQINNRIAIGAAISPTSSYNGGQFDISILIWKVRRLVISCINLIRTMQKKKTNKKEVKCDILSNCNNFEFWKLTRFTKLKNLRSLIFFNKLEKGS